MGLHTLQECAQLLILAHFVQALLVVVQQCRAELLEAPSRLRGHALVERQPHGYRLLLQCQRTVEQLLEDHQVLLAVAGAGRSLAIQRHEMRAHGVVLRPLLHLLFDPLVGAVEPAHVLDRAGIRLVVLLVVLLHDLEARVVEVVQLSGILRLAGDQVHLPDESLELVRVVRLGLTDALVVAAAGAADYLAILKAEHLIAVHIQVRLLHRRLLLLRQLELLQFFQGGGALDLLSRLFERIEKLRLHGLVGAALRVGASDAVEAAGVSLRAESLLRLLPGQLIPMALVPYKAGPLRVGRLSG